ncbi:Xaa-Pro aminopeptidase [Haloplanus vescus]|uniref:Xaa-Pro aminopeptidase n=1 Tax=Haloplanus vescus TaxID=555874 RepID=A0A1H3WI00_9EURY|nr:Xaa-Pro peptidase family protein [Haloplanus vescus]SDZ86786.1 Xaa-Pro aminopeptidase [Haloplanus vescus]
MQPDFSTLDATLGDHDGYLLDADGTDSTQRYLSGFDAPDPFVTCYTPEGTHLLVSGLEYGRANADARADTVDRLSAYDYRDRVQELGRETGRGAVVADFLAEHGVESVLVPGRFPLGTADGLRGSGVRVEVDESDAVAEIRAVKTDEEIEHVRRTQRANERAMAAAETLIDSASVVDGVLHHEGDSLTSEAVRREIELTLLESGCALDETIVACGADAADPHDRGSGPLRAGEPIVVDIFPRDKETRYHADMTRTFVRGEPSETVREWFELTDEARRAALDAVEPGVTGAAVHDAVCDVYEDAGLPTLRADPDAETGFIHSTGHGVGLDVHELPRIAPDGGELEPGNVVTIEPGLYDPDVGGVRIEDLVVVTEDGYENLTEYPVEL